MQPGKQLKPALRALLISNIWILAASCSESIHEVDFVLERRSRTWICDSRYLA